MTSIEYSKYNAFASGPLKGNPAAVVVLPKPDTPSQAKGSGDGPDANFPYGIFPSNSTLQTIATTINYPMTAFVVPFDAAAEGTDSPGFALRWFNPSHEAPLCGHATVATSNHLFSTLPGPPRNLKLLTRLHGVVSASLQDNPVGEGKLVGIEFPEKYNLPSVAKGSQRWGEMQQMFEQASASKWTDKGEPLGVYEDEQYVLVEFSPELDLKGLQLDAKVLTKLSKFVYMFQISTDSSEHIHTRVLNTFDGNHHEDIATGSAHRVIVPHALTHPETKSRLEQYHPEQTGNVLRIVQQSSEGGELVVEWLKETKMVRIMGRCTSGGQDTLQVSAE